MARFRLDQILVSRGLVQSRARAADLVARGAVRIGDDIARKAGQMIDDTVAITVDETANAYVARSGAKLAAALDHFGFAASGRIALDIGASTGGFTQVLLERGAARVYGVEVGRDQLHARLRADTRIVSLEQTDARDLTPILIPEPIDAIVADVSFISLTQALPKPLAFAVPGAWLVALVKPQFEAGREALAKRGVVKDEAARAAAVSRIAAWLRAQGWRVVGDMVSPLPGKDGNIEHLIGATLP
ncbi:MAG: TlyA family RNA methyltransferase [Hyphomicrobiaceae bacterium]